MVAFEWFVFRPLTEEKILSYLATKTDSPKRWYDKWSDFYANCAFRFYKEQYNRHILLEFREFSRAYYLKIDYPDLLTDDKINDWQNWKNEAKLLQQHWEVAEELMRINYEKYKSESVFKNARDIAMENFLDSKEGWFKEEENLKGLWFNSNITLPTSENFKKLKSLPYLEYLKSSHWKRVRAAMLLIEYARCKNCNHGDSFYGGDNEQDIHVHHLHYKNLGCERYEDINLLCQMHHCEAHSKNV